MTTAREIMTPLPEYVEATSTVADVAALLAREDIGAVPVCNAAGRLQGLVTDRDIVVQVVAAGDDPAQVRAGDIAGAGEVVTIGADDSIAEAIETMAHYKVRRLPVIDGQDLVGMVSLADIARAAPDEPVGALLEAISS
jgi:CBS domain-containing protein